MAESKQSTRLSVLREQLETSWEFFRPSLDGLTDDEIFWQPVSEWWSVRRRAEVHTESGLGSGEWVLEMGEMRRDEEPMTTIAWLLGHHASSMMLRTDYTFGSKSLLARNIPFPGSAGEMLSFLDSAQAAWLQGLATLCDEDLDTIGLCSYPEGLDPEMPFSSVIWWTNRELIHHGAEIGIVREFYKLAKAGRLAKGSFIRSEEGG